MAVKYNVADTKLLSNDVGVDKETKIRVKLRQVLAKYKGPYEESMFDIVQEKYYGFLKQYEEDITDELGNSLLVLYEKKVSSIKIYLEKAKVHFSF